MSQSGPLKLALQAQNVKHVVSSTKQSAITSDVVSFKYAHTPFTKQVAEHNRDMRVHVYATHYLNDPQEAFSKQCSSPSSLIVLL